jgi:glycosyltransferase involved in cell wall biosynthesis
MKKVSIIIPCHNEQGNIASLYRALATLMDSESGYEWEIIIVNDGSTDNTLLEVKQLRAADSRVCYIDLSRNFGKENAMLAGFDHATGHCAVVMDADLQDPPEVVSQMLRAWEEGYDDIFARRTDRGKESIVRKTLTRQYYRLLQRIAKIDVLPDVGDFRLLDSKCIDALRQLRETQRYTKGIYCWIGYRKKEILFQRGSRTTGQSSFNTLRLFNLAIEGITSYTTSPLRLSTIFGIIVSLVAFIYMCYFLIKTIIYGDPVQGFPTLIIVILFLGGIQLLSLGIIGEYLGRIFYETKQRPVYLIREKQGFTN